MQNELRQKFEEMVLSAPKDGIGHAAGMMNYITGLMQAAYNLALEDKWINVTDRLPENMEHVLLYSSDQGRYTGHLEMYENYNINEEWHIGDYCYPFKTITHWMPLPQPPKTK